MLGAGQALWSHTGRAPWADLLGAGTSRGIEISLLYCGLVRKRPLMANPPFNVDQVDREKIKDDPRYPLGMPRADNANYLWIELFYSALNPKGRAGFVMANSAADARQSEMEIRKKLLLAPAVDVMIAIGPNFFYTVTLPCTLWFFDKGKARTDRKDKVLFIDA